MEQPAGAREPGPLLSPGPPHSPWAGHAPSGGCSVLNALIRARTNGGQAPSRPEYVILSASQSSAAGIHKVG